MGSTPNKIDQSYDFEGPVASGDPKRVAAFEAQRAAAESMEVNKEVQEKKETKLKDTNTFRQRLPDTAYRRRAEDPHWGDKVFTVDTTKGDKGYEAGGGLAWGKLKNNPDSVSQLVRTGKVQPVPQDSHDTNILPRHYAAIADPEVNAQAKLSLRPYALQVYDRLSRRQGRGEGGDRVRKITRDLFGTMRRPKVLDDAQFYMKKPVDSILPMLELYPEYFQIDPNKEKTEDKQGEGTFIVGMLDYPDDAAGLSRVPTVRDAEPAERGMIASSSADPVMAGAAAGRAKRAGVLRAAAPAPELEPERESYETTREWNRARLAWHNRLAPRRQQLKSVTALKEYLRES
jgi:hypothetical protein